MDKIKFYEKKEFRLFGKKVFEIETQFERCDLQDLNVIDPVIELPLKFENKKRKEK